MQASIPASQLIINSCWAKAKFATEKDADHSMGEQRDAIRKYKEGQAIVKIAECTLILGLKISTSSFKPAAELALWWWWKYTVEG